MTRVIAALGFLCCVLVCSNGNRDVQSVVQYFTEPEVSAEINEATKELSNVLDRPYMTSMRMKAHWYSKSVHCDAAVVGDRWVMTSARCCVKSCGTPYTPSQVRVRSGSSSLDTGGTEHQTQRIMIMDGYNIRSTQNNLCLLEIQGSFTFGSRMKAVEMAEDEDIADDVFAKISGWSKKDGIFNDQMLTMTMPLINNTKCQELYAASGKSASDITENMFCTVTSEQNVCHGEGGTPLLINGKLAGIVAEGSGCGNNPGIFTRVNKYQDWIKQLIVDNNIDIRSSFTGI